MLERKLGVALWRDRAKGVEDGLGLYEKGPDDRLFVGFYVVVLTFVRFGVNEVIFVNTVKTELGG